MGLEEMGSQMEFQTRALLAWEPLSGKRPGAENGPTLPTRASWAAQGAEEPPDSPRPAGCRTPASSWTPRSTPAGPGRMRRPEGCGCPAQGEPTGSDGPRHLRSLPSITTCHPGMLCRLHSSG